MNHCLNGRAQLLISIEDELYRFYNSASIIKAKEVLVFLQQHRLCILSHSEVELDPLVMEKQMLGGYQFIQKYT